MANFVATPGSTLIVLPSSTGNFTHAGKDLPATLNIMDSKAILTLTDEIQIQTGESLMVKHP